MLLHKAALKFHTLLFIANPGANFLLLPKRQLCFSCAASSDALEHEIACNFILMHVCISCRLCHFIFMKAQVAVAGTF